MNNLLLFFIFLFSLCACDPCRNDECPAKASFPFRVVNSNGINLIGSTFYRQLYSSDSIRVFGLNQKQERVEVNLFQDGPTLYLPLEYQFKEYLIGYSFAENDTLSFEMEEYSDKCCGQVVTDYEVRINGVPPSNGTKEKSFIFIK